MTEIVDTARRYAISCHSATHHSYDGRPYEYHLSSVFEIARRFIHLIPEGEQDNILAGCWVHDVCEDCRETYNNIKAATSERVAELAYALTNEKGKTRAERANDKYYAGIKETPGATFIKVCDRIANYEYSKYCTKAGKGKNKMEEKYRMEMPGFIEKLHDPQYQEMFDYLLKITESK